MTKKKQPKQKKAKQKERQEEEAAFLALVELIEQRPKEFAELAKKSPKALEVRGFLHETLLHYLAVEDDADSVRLLIELGADVNVRNELGKTPLMDCAMIGNTRMMELLLVNQADANLQDTDLKNTALHIAAEYNQPPAFELLKKWKADLSIKNVFGCTPGYG
ncbi:MAG: ankyrin repeat domain-containing protein [Verrucomicrobiota bacterium]